MAAPAWRFNAESLTLEERFGYQRQLWPRANALIGIKPGMRVLDVGCGPGAFSRFAAWAMEGRGEVVAVDRDEELLAKARASLPSTDALRVEFRQADALKLPFADASFDAVISGFLLCVVPEPLRFLREMKRVAKPGAVVASISCFCKSGIFPTFAGLHAFEGADRLEELRRRFVDARRVFVRNPALGLPNGKDLDVWGDYARAGLVDLRIDGFLTVFAASDARWSDADAREYTEGRRRVELDMIDRMTPAQVEGLAPGGFTAADLAEMRALMVRKYEWLVADDARIRAGMELYTEPSVLITGRRR